MKKLISLCLLAAAIATVGATTSSAGSRPAHNGTDTIYAQKIIPHHEHGIEMAEMAVEKASRPEVKQLAQRIIKDQNAEIKRMSSYLRSYGVKRLRAPMPEIQETVMAKQMAALEAATGADFDRQFLTLMQSHHLDGVDMADIEIDGGRDRRMVKLATGTAKKQLEEAEQMEAFLTAIR